MAVTLKNIAEIVGCSPSIVSDVLNDTGRKTRVSEEKRNQILAVAKEKHYRSNLNARRLAGKSTKTIGLIICPHISIIQSDMISRLSKLLKENGYNNYACFPANGDQELAAIENFISLGFDGIIANNLLNRIDQAKYSIPMIFIGAMENNYDISSDVHYGEYLATKHLLGHGHKRIGFFSDRQLSNQRKFNGYIEALSEKGINPGGKWVLDFLHNPDFGGSLEKLIKKNKISAFVCTGDITGGRLMTFLISRGYRVPEDIAITGYDGSFTVEMTPCPMTSVVMPLRELASRGVELLLDKISNKVCRKLDPPIFVKPKLFIGGSCGCPKHVPGENISYTGSSFTLEETEELMLKLPPEQVKEEYRYEY